MSNLIEQLNELKNIKPNQDWVNAQRELLMSQIQVQSSKKHQSFVLNSWFFVKSLMPSGLLRFVARPIGVVTIMALFIVSSGILGVNASRLSLPGDFLYPVKLTSEKVQVGLIAGDENKAEKRVEFAEERVKEIEAVAAKEIKAEDKKKKITIAADALKTDLKKAQDNLDKAKSKPQQSKETETNTVQVAKSLDQKVEGITEKIAQKKQELKEDKDISKVLDEVTVEAENTSVKAVEVIINRVERVEVDISKKELVEVIEKKIESTAKKVEEAKALLDDLAAENVSDDQNINDSDIEDSNETGDQTNESTGLRTTTDAEKALEEARDLLNQGDLSSAMEIVKQTVELTKEVQSSVNVIVESPAPSGIQVEVMPVEAADSNSSTDDSVDENGTQVN